ncbi:MAG: hypothetical protein IPH51_19580 [Rubrivivax sp.]|nr:hypothetical protein [Rubrivivax sp.]
MNGVLGTIEVLERSRLTEQQQAEMVRTARDSGRTLPGIIDDILDFFRRSKPGGCRSRWCPCRWPRWQKGCATRWFRRSAAGSGA